MSNVLLINPFTPKSAKFKTEEKINLILQNCQKQKVKVLLKSFHLNCHTLGFHPQTQKLQPNIWLRFDSGSETGKAVSLNELQAAVVSKYAINIKQTSKDLKDIRKLVWQFFYSRDLYRIYIAYA